MSLGIIYGDCASRHAYKLYVLRAMLKLDIEWRFSDISVESTRAERRLAGNPMGQVPLLALNDARTIPESNAALVYLAKDSDLLPNDDYERAQVLRWLMFEQSQIEPALAVSLSLQKGAYQVDNTELILAYLKPQVERLLAAVNEHLTQNKREWFVGQACSIADIALYAYLHEAETGGFAVSDAMRQWLKRCEIQPGWVSAAEAMAAERTKGE